MTGYPWIMFDADNTLFDFDLAETTALAAAFERVGLPYLASYGLLYRGVNAAIWREFEAGQISAASLRVERFERLFSAAALPLRAADFSPIYLNELARSAQLLPGAEELVRALLQNGARLALATNGLPDVQRPRLAASPLKDCFSAVIISEEIGAQKPDPLFFEIAFAQMGSPARAEVLLVGDGLSSDIQGGIAFGLDTCWYNPAARPIDPRCMPTWSVQTLAAVLPIACGQATSRP